MANQLEIGLAQQGFDIRFLAREKVVEADHIVFLSNKSLAEVRAQKAGAAGNQDAFDAGHAVSLSCSVFSGIGLGHFKSNQRAKHLVLNRLILIHRRCDASPAQKNTRLDQ